MSTDKSIRISEETYNKIKDHCKKDERTITWLVKKAVDAYIDGQDKKKK